MEALVCDVDNTICDTRPRVRRCLERIGRGEVYARSSNRYGGFKEHLAPDELQRFFRVFLSDEWLDADAPLPGAAETLRAWLETGRALVYLTGRHDAPGDSMRAGTLRWLTAHGFPLPNGATRLIMKRTRFDNDVDHKRAALEALPPELEARFGLGDLPQEGPLYGEMGIRPILLSAVGMFPAASLRRSHPEVIVAADWGEVAALLGI